MRRAILILVVVTTALAASALGRGTANAVPAATHPTLRLMDSDSVTLRGVGFKRREHVRVSVTEKTSVSKSVAATTTGTFVVSFANLDLNLCVGLSATAVGSDGSRATFKRAPGMCPVQ
jgi:hypothetical protein